MTPEHINLLILALFGAGGVGALVGKAIDTWRARKKEAEDGRREDLAAKAEAEVKLSAQWQEMVGRLEARITYLETALANLHSEYLRVVQENATMKAELHAARSDVHAAEMRVQQLTSRVTELEAALGHRVPDVSAPAPRRARKPQPEGDEKA